MATYDIAIYGTVSTVITVEADSLDEAVDLALDRAPQTSLGDSGFDGVADWEVDDNYYLDGEYVEASK